MRYRFFFKMDAFIDRLHLNLPEVARGVGIGGGGKGAKAPPTLKITQKVPFSFEVKCPFSLWKRFFK